MTRAIIITLALAICGLAGCSHAVAEQPSSAKHAVLLLVDVQNDFWGPDMARQNPSFEGNVATLLATCRKRGIEVIHVHTEFDADSAKRPASFNVVFGQGQLGVKGTEGAKVLPGASVKKGEKVFLKHAFSSFSNKDLEKYLVDNGKNEVLIAGLTIEMCVLSTAFGAMDNGHTVKIVTDCCGAARPEATQFVVGRYGFMFQPIGHRDLIPK